MASNIYGQGCLGLMISVELISVASLFRAAESVPRGCVVQRGAMRPYLGWLPRSGPGSNAIYGLKIGQAVLEIFAKNMSIFAKNRDFGLL